MSRLSWMPSPIAGLGVVERKPIADSRGAFTRLFCAQELASMGWTRPVAQINHSYTRNKGALRGLHFQCPPCAEAKLVTVLRGAVFDVAVDLRVGSETFLRWYAQELSNDNNKAMYVPEGFAHGFQTLTEDVEMLYCHSLPYNASAEGGLNPLDGRIGVAWPLPVSDLSQRDAELPVVDDNFSGISLV